MSLTSPLSIVISAVSIRKGGTLTVLRDCLSYLSGRPDLQVNALVHKRSLCEYPGIKYIEIPDCAGNWWKRWQCEYHGMRKLSEKLQPVDLWLSLHDTTPDVLARRQAVYCQTSFPFLKVRARDLRMDPKIPAFAWLTKYVYRKNAERNRYLIVQQEWFRDSLSCLLRMRRSRFIVAPPTFRTPVIPCAKTPGSVPTFIYPATPDCHKNVELLCETAFQLEQRWGTDAFKVILTIRGNENRYAAWLHRTWGHVSSIHFRGYLPKEELYKLYGEADCLVFPSRIETWGLPISEFKSTGRPMLLANLPYARESAAGASQVAFFNPEASDRLAFLMEEVMLGKDSEFTAIPPSVPSKPYAPDWESLFNLLLEPDESIAAW